MSNWKENSAVKESYTLSRADTHSTFNDVERKRSLELTFSTTSGKDSATVPEIGKITSLDSPIKWSHMKNKFEIGHASLQRTTSEVFKEDNNFSKNQPLHENSEIYLKASNVKAFINKTLENRSQNGNKKLECSNNTLPKNFNSKETFKTLSNNDNYVCFQLYDRQLYKNTTSYNNHVYQPTEIRGPGSKSISKSDNKMDSPKTVQASCKPCNNSSTPNQYKPYSSRKDYNNLKVIKTAQIPYSNVRNFVVRNAISNVTGSDRNTETAFPSFTEITGGHTKTGVIKNSINSSRNNNWDNLKMSKYSTMPISRTFNISERSKVSQLKEKFDHQFAEKLTDEKLHSDEKAGTELNTNRGLKRDKTACGNRINSNRSNSSSLFEGTSKHSEISTNKHLLRSSEDTLETGEQLAACIQKPQTSSVKQFIKTFEEYENMYLESLERSKQKCSVKLREDIVFRNFTWSEKPENRDLKKFQNTSASLCGNSKYEEIKARPEKERNFDKCQERHIRPKSLTESNSYVTFQVRNFEQLTKSQSAVQNKNGSLSVYSTHKLFEDEKTRGNSLPYRHSAGKQNEYLHNFGLNITDKPSTLLLEDEIYTSNGQENGSESEPEDRKNEIAKIQDNKEICEVKPQSPKRFSHRLSVRFSHRLSVPKSSRLSIERLTNVISKAENNTSDTNRLNDGLVPEVNKSSLNSNDSYTDTNEQLKSDHNCIEAVNIQINPEEDTTGDLDDSYFKNGEENLNFLKTSLDCTSASSGCNRPYNEIFECNSLVRIEDGFCDVGKPESRHRSKNKRTKIRRRPNVSVNSKRPYSNMRMHMKVKDHIYQNTSILDTVPVYENEPLEKTTESEHIYEYVCFKDSSNYDQPSTFDMGSDSGVCLEESKLQMQYPSSVSTGQVPESQHRLVEHQVPKQTDAQLVMSSDIKVKQEVSSLENMINSTTQKSSKKHSLTKTLFQKTKDRLFSWKENSLTAKTGSNFYVPYTSEKASPQERPLPPLPCVSTPLDVTKSKACEQIENASGEEDYKVKSCMEPESFLESVMSSIEWNPYLRFSKLSDSTESGIFMNKRKPCDSSTPSAAIDPKSCEDCVTDDSGFKEKKPLNILNIYSNFCSITPNTRVSHLNSCGSPPQPSTCLKQISLEGKRTLWKDIPEVMKSGLLEMMTSQQIQQQEALFEIITSEVSYLRSLDILVEHFVNCPELTSQLSANRILEQAEREMLFSDILPVRTISQRLLAELKARLSEGLLIPNICDILLNYALNHFSIYVKYCSNKIYQEMMLYSLRQNKPEFKTLLEKLEKSPVCQNLSVDSFLILPMQRITRFPLLVKAVCDRLPIDSPDFKISILALKAMNKVVKDCNEGAEVMEKRIEMLCLSHQLEFKICESFKLMSASRWLVKKGEVIWLSPDQRTKSTLGRTTHCTKVPIHMFLFTDLLVLAKKNSEEKYTVIVYCQRKFVQIVLLNRSLKPNIPAHTEDCKKVFLLLMSNNHKGKTTEVILSCSSKSECASWVEALNPATSENSSESIYEYSEFSDVQLTRTCQAKYTDGPFLSETSC